MIDSASMLASVPADFFSAAADMPVPDSGGDIGTDDAPIEPDTAPEPEAIDSTPVAEPEGVVEPEAVPETPATPEDSLEDGIVKSRDGKKFELTAGRYETVYGHHKMVQQATEAIGEPLTLDGITHRHEALLAQERLYSHLTSGDPAQQAPLVKFFVNEMKSAHDSGETGIDPTVPFAETVYTTLRDEAPAAYDALRLRGAKDLLTEMFDMATRDGDMGLLGASQRFAAKLAGVGPKPADMSTADYVEMVREATAQHEIPWRTPQDAKPQAGEDPLAAVRRENAELKARLDGRQTTTAAEQYGTWDKGVVKATNDAVVKEAVEPSLSSVADSWKDFPEDYKRLVVDPLNGEINKAVRADGNLQNQVSDLRDRARRATSESIRQQIGDQIRNLYVNRAKLAAEAARSPILKFAAETLKGRSVQTNARRTAAQTRSAPNGTTTPVRQSVMPEVSFKNGVYDSGTAMKQMLALMPR